jgi:hypothetical protein
VKAAAIGAALVGAVLPFGGASNAVAAPPPREPTCAGVFADGIAYPAETVVPLSTGYSAISRVTSGQESIINTVNNTDAFRRAGAGPQLGRRFSASLKTVATPAFNEIINGDRNQQAASSYGYLSVSWSNGRDIDPHSSGSLGIPSGVEYKLPKVEIREHTSQLIAPFNKLVVAKGLAMDVPGTAGSIASVAPSAIIQTLASVPGAVVSGDVDVIAGSLTLKYSPYYFPTRQSLFMIYPDSVADLTAEPAFVAQANIDLAALMADYEPVVAGSPDDSCSPAGLVMVACAYAPTLLPPSLDGLCDELA